jgi:hypothetical protein
MTYFFGLGHSLNTYSIQVQFMKLTTKKEIIFGLDINEAQDALGFTKPKALISHDEYHHESNGVWWGG